ncbi:EamA family transporter [Corynebacterium timonense]|uniref:Inner membrane transporter RhtA n=1 Tax=Corynebacterium timonense TaxID=441500 RepID=A0A1H1MP93_9CORY|nr:EamA family transporter [Corynebacterium timonense]SDR88165.1 inner membrane transporter RhtA [Corynebacterium timonense]
MAAWAPAGVMVLSGASLYAGAAIAVGLFDAFPPALVAWLRISAAALMLVVLRRPALRAFIGSAGARAAVFGAFTLGMNMAFYMAISSIPLGTAVAVEFLGPVAVAALGSRTLRDWCALLAAAAGVSVISGATWTDHASGIAWALAAGALWAGYIVTGTKIAARGSSTDSIAVGFTWAAILAAPAAALLWPAGAIGHDIEPLSFLGLWLGLGLLSAAVPYTLDQVVMRLAGASYFALLQAILPLVAALIGAVALGQVLSPGEMVGVVLIVAAVVLRRP